MKTLEGDLVQLAREGQFDLIVHGCNCFHTMGAGIARSIAEAFPAAVVADRVSDYGSPRKLGTYSSAVCSTSIVSKSVVVINAYTQYRPGPHAEYGAIANAFKMLRNTLKSSGRPDLRVGYPMIGCGIGGLDWTVVKKLIDWELSDLDHTLVLLPQS